MVKFILVAAWAVVPLAAQWGSLATTYDGSRVYFVTSLRQAGTDQPLWGKLFAADDTGIHPLAIRNRDVLFSCCGGVLTNDYFLDSVAVAHDGSRLALLGVPLCNWTSSCAYSEHAHTDIYDRSGAQSASLPGHSILSPNGRWALLMEVSYAPGIPTRIVDLDSGASTPSPVPLAGGDWRAHAIADNGMTVLADPYGAVHFFAPGGTPYSVEASADSASIDAAGNAAVWAEYADRSYQGPRRLRILDTSSRSHHVLFERGDSHSPALSDDGRRVLFISTATSDGKPQAFLIGTDGAGARQVTNEPSGVQAACFSGDGHVAWFVAGDGSLLKVSVATGERSEFIGPTARVDALGPTGLLGLSGSPGMPVQITGERLTAGTEIRIAGVAAPVLAADGTSLTFQIPWQTRANADYEVEVITEPRDPGWDLAIPLTVGVETPRFLPQALHEDFASLVTPESPAVAGETVHLFATGLGPVEPAVATGQPAPDSPLSYLIKPIRCDLYFSRAAPIAVDVPFAALAPGMIGIYAMDLTLPSTLPPPFPPGEPSAVSFNCHDRSAVPGPPFYFSGGLPVKP